MGVREEEEDGARREGAEAAIGWLRQRRVVVRGGCVRVRWAGDLRRVGVRVVGEWGAREEDGRL
jgi:hypothetical protein